MSLSSALLKHVTQGAPVLWFTPYTSATVRAGSCRRRELGMHGWPGLGYFSCYLLPARVCVSKELDWNWDFEPGFRYLRWQLIRHCSRCLSPHHNFNVCLQIINDIELSFYFFRGDLYVVFVFFVIDLRDSVFWMFT